MKNVIKIRNEEITIPNEYRLMDRLSTDPEEMIVYGKQNNNSFINIMIQPYNVEQSLPSNVDDLIEGTRNYLNDKQGLIEAKNGTTKNNIEYVYTIVKDLDNTQHEGTMYFLTIEFKYSDYVIDIQGYFQEIGTTGIRDSIVYAECLKNKTISGLEDWLKDPYDKNNKKGILMNISEKEEYDEMFKEHPLTECREFIKYIVDNN